jgi:hypothetical protein
MHRRNSGKMLILKFETVTGPCAECRRLIETVGEGLGFRCDRCDKTLCFDCAQHTGTAAIYWEDAEIVCVSCMRRNDGIEPMRYRH